MNGYNTSIHRAIFGLAAIAMTAFSLEVLVILPAEFDRSDGFGPVSGMVTAAHAGVSAIAASSDPDSFRQPASATTSCTTEKPDPA